MSLRLLPMSYCIALMSYRVLALLHRAPPVFHLVPAHITPSIALRSPNLVYFKPCPKRLDLTVFSSCPPVSKPCSTTVVSCVTHVLQRPRTHRTRGRPGGNPQPSS
ncbi:hypothetical protein E2C01_099157 [Portunus trituberculatus]|uniref:Secreted protein n=1 Tax=Portunus trituberculatus TaxID=210409 RepID=A0A5B7K9L0_PORTR|nr:hypothetical protein [Portunus trituberculatus]